MTDFKKADRRTKLARRHKALVKAFAADLGDNLSAADRAFIDHCATIAVACEAMKEAQLSGETVDLDQLVRLANAMTRVRKELSARQGDPRDLTSEAWEQVMFEEESGNAESNTAS